MSKGKVTLRDYEIVYIFHPSVEEDRVNEKLTRYHGLIAGENGGEITALDHWGRRQLAYAIDDNGSERFTIHVKDLTSGALLPDTIPGMLSDIVWIPRPYLTPYAASKAAAWSYTNQLRFHLRERGIQVLGLHVGFVDTDLTNGIDVPKASPEDVVRQTYDALAAGKSEVMADEGTAVLKRTLAAEIPGYITPPAGL